MTAQPRRVLWSQVGDVLADLPFFLTAPLHRRGHLRWGASPDEVIAAMPGDDLFPDASFRATRAISIAAPPELVWPWLVQLGCGRAGWYSNDLLDNAGRPSATTIQPQWQDLQVGQWIPMSPKPPPTERSAFRVDSFEVDRWLLWTKPDSTWSWKLTPIERRRHATRQPDPRRLRLEPSARRVARGRPDGVRGLRDEPPDDARDQGSRRVPRR